MSRAKITSQIRASFGSVPDWLGQMPDEILEQFWPILGWTLCDTHLSARDKSLIAFGAASAVHCEYCILFHTAQFTLRGMGEEHVREASWVVNAVVGVGSYLYGVGYNKAQYQAEMAATVATINSDR